MASVEQRRGRPRNKPRGKTYSGCWTCRSRKVKCDEEKPICRRCTLASLVCQGYHVKLVWASGSVGDGENLVCRRSTLDGDEHLRPVLGDRYLRGALCKIDAWKGDTDLQVGPFSVFSLSRSRTSSVVDCQQPIQYAAEESAEDSGEVESISPGPVSWGESLDHSCLEEGDEDARDENAADDHCAHDNCADDSDADADETVTREDAATMAVTRVKQQIIPHLGLYLSTASPDERQLLHFWITNLSGMMIPTQRQDNPFRTIFIPLALSSSQTGECASGNAALLHAIYALSAFNRAQVSAAKEHFLSVGTQHHQKSLQYLRRNLMETDGSQREALLATIIAMSSIEVIRGTSSTWRIHLAGGRTWLETIRTSGWADEHSANVLQQIFLCVEALNTEHMRRPRGESSPGDTCSESSEPVHTTPSPEPIQTGYILDKVFGITEPIFRSLLRINQLSRLGHPVPAEELDELECQIRLSDPDAMVTDADQEYDQLTQHHACAFYNACLIHFHRTLRRTPPGRLQRLVQRSLYHLGEIDKLETDMNVCGLLWPLFVTACEVEASSKLRRTCIRLFDKGRLVGIGNMCSATTVVLEVWRRRDEDVLGVDITWQEVMDDLGMDILLT